LRQEAEAQAATDAYLFKPETGIRIRFATNDPTPWPPELPAGENPPPGPILDYYLAKSAQGPVTVQILTAAGKVVRTYSSNDNPTGPTPAEDAAAYNELCKQNPAMPDCALPLYWPAPPMRVSTEAGMHRIWWDLHFEAIGGGGGRGGASGAVPGRTYTTPNSPLAEPGAYQVKLTVDGKSYTQPFTLKMDPRVKTSEAGLAELYRLTNEMYNGAVAAHQAYDEARAELAKTSDPARQRQLEALAPAARGGAGRGGRGGRGAAGPAGPPNLNSVSSEELMAAMAMQGADRAPTAAEVEA